MDDIRISLPCGFSAKYNEIYYNTAKFPCPVCKSHNLMRQECLDMPRNKLMINEFYLEQKKDLFQQCLENIEICKCDPKSYIDENYQNLKNQLDIRREEIKLIVDKKIDDYYDDLIKIIEEEKETKLNEFKTRIQQIPSLEKEIMDFKIENSTDMTNKLDLIDDFSDKIENGITFLNKVKDDLETNKWIFNPGDESLDIKDLFGELDLKEETKGIQKTDHLNKMDNVSVILPCGFSAKYKDILNKSETFPCPDCKTHRITKQKCLNMARNRLVLIEKSFELKKKQYDELMKEFNDNKNKDSKDQQYYIFNSYDKLKKEVNLRRKNIKDLLNRAIEVYHDGLLKKIDIERDLKFKEWKERINNTEELDFNMKDVDLNLDIETKINFYNSNIKKIDNGINLVQNIKNNLIEAKYGLTNSIDDIDLKKLFGELYSKEKTIIIFNEDEIDDDSRTEATIQLTINNFSLLKDTTNFGIRSKKFVFRNLEWYISIELNEEDGEMGLNEEDGEMGFYLHCNPKEESNEFLVNVTAELTLLNKSDSKKDFKENMTYILTEFGCYGFQEFIRINEITNPTNGYYDANDDSITLKAFIKAEQLQKNLHDDDDDDEGDQDYHE